jgi:integrase/recombinase XerD
VADAVRAYIQAAEAKGRAAGTLEQYSVSLKAYEASGLGGMPIADVAEEDVEAFLAWRRTHVWKTKVGPGGAVCSVRISGRTASPSVLARDRSLLCSVFARLVKRRLLDRNPVANVDAPKKKQRRYRFMEKSEVVAFLKECDPDHLRPLALAGFYTGQGGGDLIQWRWRDIGFTTGTVSVTRKKTGKSELIPLHPVLATELEALRERRAKATGRIPSASEHVFHSRYGRAYARFPKEAWRGAIRRAGLTGRKLTPHTMRHSFATHFPGADVDCQRILGHADLKTTLIYRKAHDERTRKGVMALDYGHQSDAERTRSVHAAGGDG